MTKEKLKQLKAKLPMGWAKTLSTRTGFSKIQVYRTLSGERDNMEVQLAAIALAEEHQLERKAISDKVSQLIDA